MGIMEIGTKEMSFSSVFAEEIKTEISHLSKSQISMILENCGHAYYLERVLGIKPSPSVGPIVGQTLHTCQEFYFRQVLECKAAPSMGTVIKAGQEKFDALFSVENLNYVNLLRKFGEPDTQGGRANIRKLKHDEFLAGLDAMLPWWSLITPKYVELPAMFDIEHRGKIRLKVFADLICDYEHRVTRIVEVEIPQFGAKGQPIKPKRIKEEHYTGEVVNVGSIDLKVSGMPKSQRTVDTDIALPIAVYAQYLTDGTLPEYAGYLNCILKTSPITRKISVAVKIIYTKIDVNKLEVMIERVKKVKDAIDCGVFLPCAPTHWKCSEDFCDHFPCKYAVKIEEEEEGDEN